jgi:transglutaminase-like putative cysteine protease
MDYTYGHVRSAVFGYFEDVRHEGPTGPDMLSYYADVNTILSDQMGICVHHERVFAHIVEAYGLPVRDVGFQYHEADGKPNAHSTAEVYYNGGWHWFDPTFGVTYKDSSGNVLSIADARAGLGTAFKDDAGFENLLAPDATWFEMDPATSVTYAAQPA